MRNQPSNWKGQDHPADENGFEYLWEKQPRNTNNQGQCSDDDGHDRILTAKMLRQSDRAEEQDPQPRKLAEHAVIRISLNVGELHVSSFWFSVGSQERFRMDRISPVIMAESSLVS